MRTSPFVVNVAALGLAPGVQRRVGRNGLISGLEVTGSSVVGDTSVDVDVELEAVPGAVIVRGVVLARWVGACRRCLGEVGGELRSEVVEVFQADHDPEETYPLAGDQLDLEPMARDAVLLELPQAPLCHPGCQGLCPVCGAERNEGSCDCEVEVADPRWAALDALRDT